MTLPSSPKRKRITSIDTLRGFALLGILVMNILSFSMPDAAYNNPTAYGGDDFLNRFIHGLSHILADQKFMALFSMLFGASIMLLFSKMKSQGKKAARVHYIRNIWLILFGLAHGLLIWEGDVLFIYGVCALFLYLFRNLKAKLKIIIGLIIFFLPLLFNLAILPEIASLDESNIQVLDDYFSPAQASIEKDLSLYQGSYLDQLAYRLGDADTVPSTAQDLSDLSFLIDAFARAFGMMLIGMAFFSMGILNASQSKRFYQRMLIFGFTLGIPIALIGLFFNYTNHWDASYSLFLGRIPNHIATPFVASGYLALIMLWSQTNFIKPLQDALMNVGRMALSNYIGQSLIASLIFYGFGLGLYGSVNRVGQIGIVIVIWIVQLVISKLWMTYFRFGPLEWLWRSLTYLRLEPILKRSDS